MRPVNLIPPEERKRSGRSRPAGSSGPIAYIAIGALVAILAGVTALVLTGNSITEHKSQIAELEQEEQAATARADSLRAYADFASVQAARTATVASLATSRFDWERVLRELALVIPPTVTLEGLTGTVNPDVSVADGSDSNLRELIAGPALSLSGCAMGHEGVAELVAALQDIDGVTRVGLSDSQESDPAAAAAAGAPEQGGCTEGATFSIVVAFDEVATAPVAPTAPAPTAPPPTTDDGGVPAAEAQQAEAVESVNEGTAKAQSAVNHLSGGG